MGILSRIKLGIGMRALQIAQSNLGEGLPTDSIVTTLLPEGSRKNVPERGTKELLQAYEDMPWLHSVVNKVSRSFATVQWQAFVVRSRTTGKAIFIPKLLSAGSVSRKETLDRLGNSKQFEVEELDTHPVLEFLNSSNMFFPGLVSRQLTQQYMDLVGEAFWIIERNLLGKPMSYFPIPPTWISQTPTLKDSVFTFKGTGGSEFNIPASDVIWFYEPRPGNPYSRGSGTAKALGDELDTDEYAAKYTKTRFINNARPDLLITAAGLKQEETERLEQDWNSSMRGFKNAMKTHFLNRDVKVTDLSPKFQELQLLELRKHERDTIFHVYGAPPELFGVNESSNRATIESAEFLFSKHVLVPRLEFHRSILQWKLAPEFDERLIIDYESPVEDDFDRELKAAEKAPWALDIDEWRKKTGLPPLADDAGKVFMVPLNLVPVKSIEPQEPVPVAPPTTPASNSMASTQDVFIEFQSMSKIPELDPDLIAELEGDPLRSVQVIDGRFVRTSTWSAVEDKLHNIVLEFGAATVAEVGEDIAFQETERVLDYVRRNGLLRSKLYDRTTQNGLAKTLVEGIRKNESLAKLTDRVESLYSGYVQNRAKTIARTESLRAANFGAEEGMKQAGIEIKEWLTTRDAFVRDAHIALDTVQSGVGGQFTVPSGTWQGMQTDFPGNFGVAELDINCRCTIIPVFPSQRSSGFDTETRRTQRWKLFESIRAQHDRELRRIVRSALNRQKQFVIKVLNGESI